jgi:hypothetical protein
MSFKIQNFNLAQPCDLKLRINYPPSKFSLLHSQIPAIGFYLFDALFGVWSYFLQINIKHMRYSQ